MKQTFLRGKAYLELDPCKLFISMVFIRFNNCLWVVRYCDGGHVVLSLCEQSYLDIIWYESITATCIIFGMHGWKTDILWYHYEIGGSFRSKQLFKLEAYVIESVWLGSIYPKRGDTYIIDLELSFFYLDYRHLLRKLIWYAFLGRLQIWNLTWKLNKFYYNKQLS